MSTRYEHPTIVYATGAAYVDPLECGSTVAYKIISTNYFDAAIDLTDCSRKISWAFRPEDVDKIDNVIHMFTEFRKELIKAGKKWEKIEAEAAAFNEANKKK